MICLVGLLALATGTEARQVDRQTPGDEDAPRQGSTVQVGPAVLSGSIWIDGTVSDADDAPDPVRVSRARVGASGRFTPRMQYSLTTDLTEPALRAAALTLALNDALAIRAGRHNPIATLERGMNPASTEALGRSIVSSQLTSPPVMAVTVFSRHAYRGVLGYALNLTKGRGWDWSDNDRSHDVSGRVTVTLPRRANVMIVASGARGRWQGSPRTLTGLGVDGRAGSWHVMAEGLHERRTEGHRSGLMLLAAYGWLPHPARGFSRFEVAWRLSAVGASSWAASRRQWQTGLNYYLTPETRLMAHISVPIDNRPGTAPSATFRLQTGF
jgi:hypothetical protein